jgi:hypothetical protein
VSISNERLAEIEARCEAATEGPWYANPGGYVELDEFGEGEHFNGIADTWNANDGKDAEFIAHARQDVPDLIATVREQAAEIERLKRRAADWEDRADHYDGVALRFCERATTAEAERDRARAALGRVEALADELEAAEIADLRDHHSADLRAALATGGEQ